MELNYKIKEALTKMDFVHKYEELSNYYNDERTPIEEVLRNVDIDVVKEMIRKLGHESSYNKREKFFKIEE